MNAFTDDIPISRDNFHDMGESPYAPDGMNYWDELSFDAGCASEADLLDMLRAAPTGPFRWIAQGESWLSVMRWACGLSAEQLAERTAIDRMRLRTIETGIAIATPDEIAAIAAAVGVSPAFIDAALT